MLRILCLHGYHGSAGILRDQMGSLAAGLDSLADFVYVNAPILQADDFGWWHAVPADDSAMRGDPGVPPGARRYKGWTRTRDWIADLFEKQGPFDGVFGFSQGAALTGMLVGLRAPDGVPTTEKPLAFGFAMMVGGFLSADPDLAGLYGSKESYALPSLHIIGRSDGIVPSEDSKALAAKFKEPLILEHGGGHVIASTPEIRKQVASFLEARIGQRASNVPAYVRPSEVPLWPGRAHPSMKLFYPAHGASGPVPAMLVFQGGAYATCFGSGGGSAEWAAEHGMVGIQVEYGTRSSGESYPSNYADGARAIRLVRRNAEAWGIDAKRIGVMGYSAGGHLASLLSTQPDLWMDPKDDLAGQASARPDLVVLAYPVISFVDGYSRGAFVGSVENFLGPVNIDDTLRRRFSNQLHVDAKHPPVFIWTTEDDGLVPYTHSQLFAEACRRAKVPVAYKLYPHGRHGLGLALGESGEVRNWTTLLLEWLKGQWGIHSCE
jgi:acetyl esterase/lipase